MILSWLPGGSVSQVLIFFVAPCLSNAVQLLKVSGLGWGDGSLGKILAVRNGEGLNLIP